MSTLYNHVVKFSIFCGGLTFGNTANPGGTGSSGAS